MSIAATAQAPEPELTDLIQPWLQGFPQGRGRRQARRSVMAWVQEVARVSGLPPAQVRPSHLLGPELPTLLPRHLAARRRSHAPLRSFYVHMWDVLGVPVALDETAGRMCEVLYPPTQTAGRGSQAQPLLPLAVRWLLSLQGQGLAPGTLVNARSGIRSLSAWLADRYGPEFALGSVSRDDLTAYRLFLEARIHAGTLAPGTARNRFHSARSFVRWLSPIRAASVPHIQNASGGRRPAISRAQVRRFFSALIHCSSRPHRDFALYLLLAAKGLRISEALALRPCDFHQGGKFWTVTVRGKGGKVRTVRIADAAVAAVARLLRIHPVEPDQPIFRDLRGLPLKYNRVRHEFRAVANRAGIPDKVTLHSFRHAYITAAIEAGTPLAEIAHDVGHANLTELSRYAHASEHWRREQIGKMDLLKGGQANGA